MRWTNGISVWIVVLEARTVVVEQEGWEISILSQLRTELMCHLWHPRCLHSRIVLILCIMCLFCLKKDLIVKIKGYLCKYDFMQGPFYSLIWVRGANIAFVDGLFVKFSVIIAWQKILLFSLKLNWICNGKDKSPLNSKSFLCFQNNSLTFGQINFCTTSKL